MYMCMYKTDSSERLENKLDGTLLFWSIALVDSGTSVLNSPLASTILRKSRSNIPLNKSNLYVEYSL